MQMPPRIDLTPYVQALTTRQLVSTYGKVTKVVGLVVEADGISAPVGELCHILTQHTRIRAEVVGFDRDKLLLMPLGELRGIQPADRVVLIRSTLRVPVGAELLGRVVDALGTPIDAKGELRNVEAYPVHNTPPNCYVRRRISQILTTGVRGIDGLMTIGKGQRIGIFAGAGVGKSTLLGMIARFTDADVNVIALIGERGREVREFIEDALGDGLSRSVVVAATSDQSPLLRVQGALTATAIAEYFRAQGKDVVLMMDSVTRFAMAQREIGLSIGEPPTTRGYTPSVFSKMPMLMERAGTTNGDGSITGIYTILVEGDDMTEPVADAAKAILDGHIVLSRAIAAQNQYPAIDVSNSLSRLMSEIVSPEHRKLANTFRQVLADYEAIQDAYNIGAYTVGMNPRSDYAIAHIEKMRDFLRQDSKGVGFEETMAQLGNMFKTPPNGENARKQDERKAGAKL